MATTEMVPDLIWVPGLFWFPRSLVPEKFGPREIWSPKNLALEKKIRSGTISVIAFFICSLVMSDKH